jgi:hypothetical protein
MFQLPEVQEILSLRREYLEKKEAFIDHVLRGYGHRLQTDTPLGPAQLRDWLALCVADAELVDEVWAAFEVELATYNALYAPVVLSDTPHWFMAQKNGNSYTTFQAADWEDAKRRTAALQDACTDAGASFTCRPVADAYGSAY